MTEEGGRSAGAAGGRRPGGGHARMLRAYFERAVPAPLRWPGLLRALERAMAVDELLAFLAELGPVRGLAAVEAILARVAVRARFSGSANIPPRGRVLVVANHPVGAADVLLLLQCVGRVRSDLRVVINRLGPAILPGIAELCIPVDSYADFNTDARQRIRAALEAEQAVILFPAGGISKPTPFGIRDHRWKPGMVRFSRDCAADVLPVHIAGRMSALYLCLPRKLRSFLVARELLHPVDQEIAVRIGPAIPHARVAEGEIGQATRRLRRSVYALGARAGGAPARRRAADSPGSMPRPGR